MNIETEQLGIPETNYSTFIKMSSSEFTKICRELSALAEVVNIDVRNNKAKFTFSGQDGSGCINLKTNYSEKEEHHIEIDCNEMVNNSFGLKYLTSFSKASSLSSRVGLYLSSSFPLMIDYDIEDIGYIKFYLAPKMD